jgi:hypothetical protein
MTSAEYCQTDLAVELEVPWFHEHLWLVPGPECLRKLVAAGVNRGAIWTAAEMTDLLGIDGVQPPDCRAVALLRTRFKAEIVSIEPWRQDTVDAAQPCRACRSTRRWRSIHGAIVCGVCHPPCHPRVVAEWIDAAEGD